MFSTLIKTVGENIRKQRELRGLSQGDLADKLKTDRSYISTLEAGHRNPSLLTLEKIARVLDVAVSLLVETSKYEASSELSAIAYIPGHIKAQKTLWQDKQWYHQRFDGAPYLIHMIGEAEITTRRNNKYGLFFDKHFCFFEDGKADWYIDIAEIERITNTVLKLAEKNPHLSKDLIKEYEPFDQDFYKECKNIENRHLFQLSNQKLIELHDRFLGAILMRNSSSSMIDGFALGSDRLLETDLKRAYEAHDSVKKLYRFSEVFSILTTPSHSSFVREAELDFLKLILAIRKTPELKNKLIREYRDRYFWIRNNYVDAHVLTASYFEDQVTGIEASELDVAAEIKNLEETPRKNQELKKSLLEKLKLDTKTAFILAMTEDFTQWQDERKKATMFTAHYATLLLEEISRRVDIPTDLLKYLSPREVSRIFIDTPPIALLEERRQGCVVYWDLAGHEIISGAETADIRSAVLGEKKISDIQDFRGMTASLGNAQGKVKILRSVKEINKIEAGDVLVAVMTRPDYVPAMKKAVAIITDEGGITSHAAIVSRELKIPCVIGTKIATQVLRDGDLVQVNANHGMIKILKRGENS